MSDNSTGQFYSSPASIELKAMKRTTYSLRTVTNACGYGAVSGETTIGVKPVLSLYRTAYTDDCVGATVPVTYSAQGDFGPDNRLTLELTTLQGVALRTLVQLPNSSGQTRVTVPGDVPPGTYYFSLRASNPSTEVTSPIYLTIKVPPVVTLTGSTTINPGQTVYLSLRNEKASSLYSNESVAYRLSDGTTGSISLSGNQSTALRVSPSQTTTYNLVSISGSCGAGTARGSATVIVNPVRENSVTTGSLERTRYCTGDKMTVPFTTSGVFSPANQFQVQLIDSTGKAIRMLSAATATSPLSVTLPDDLLSAGGYRLRVVATDANINSGASPAPLQIYRRAMAFFDSTTYFRQPGRPTSLTIRFDGQGPWYYTINSDLGGLFSGTSETNPLSFTPFKEGNLYTLISVRNETCGTGAITTPASTRVELLTANETALSIGVWPNPTSDIIQLSLPSVLGNVTLQLTDMTGRLLLKRSVKTTTDSLNLSPYPTGLYLLTLEINGQRNTYRLIKN
jgi:urease beta subunit